MKKVLVIGGGGREHAIVYALSRSPQVEKIYCAPGNAGIALLAECVAIKDTDVEGLLLFAKETEVDLTVVGPEAALAAGVVDAFRKEGMPIFGHTKAATQIESSKEFAKIIMDKYQVPTAGYQSFSDYTEALAYVKAGTLPTVLKYDGLAAGKGVVIATTLEEADAALQDMLCNEAFGKGKVVIEDYLEGPEFSFMCFVNGENVYPMPLSQDHNPIMAILSTLFYIALTFLLMGFLIFVHELGHYLTARACKVTIHEFSLGMGKRLCGFTSPKTGIQYSLRLFPIGGYVAMAGEDADTEGEEDDPNAFNKKNVWQRLLILVAGAGMNVITGALAMLILVGGMTAAGYKLPSTTVAEFTTGASSYVTGLETGDRILSVDGVRVHTGYDLSYEIMFNGYKPGPCYTNRLQ